MGSGLRARADKLTSRKQQPGRSRGCFGIAVHTQPHAGLGPSLLHGGLLKPALQVHLPWARRLQEKVKTGCIYNGRAQRTRLAPLRKTATSWLPSRVLDSPLQASRKQTGREHNSELKSGISTEFLRQKDELAFEAFLKSCHGIILRPEDFKRAKGGRSPG